MKYIILVLLCWMYMAVELPAQQLSLGFLYPAGGTQGSVVELEVGGVNLASATQVLISGEGIKAEIIPLPSTAVAPKKKKGKGLLDDQSSPQLAARIRLRVYIDKKASPGLRDLRLKSLSGVSNKLSFEVGQYPQVVEQKGSSLSQPNQVAQLPATLCGQILPGEVDVYSFKATKGMKFVAEVKARILVPYIADAVPGWFQPIVRLINSQGKEIAFNDDYRNQVDPVMVVEIPETDVYRLMINDAIYRGREDFNYRIDLGEIPHLDYVYPAVGVLGKKMELALHGVNLNTKKLQFTPMAEGIGELKAKGSNGMVSNGVPFLGLNKNTEIKTSAASKGLVTDAMVVFDTIDSPYQLKTYKVYADKNENIALEVKARRLGSLMDARITLRDSTGKVLLVSDDVEDPSQGLMTFHADPTLQYKATEKGCYIVQVEDILGGSGNACYFTIQRKKSLPSFDVFVSPAQLSIPQGGTAVFRMDINSGEEKVPALEVQLKGLPKDFLVSSLQTQGGSKTWELSVTSPKNAKQQTLNLEVQVRPQFNNNGISTDYQKANAADNMMQAFYYTHHLPAVGFVANVIEASPFSLHLSQEIESALDQSILVSATDTVVPLTIRIDRQAEFTDSVELRLSKKSKIITLDPISMLPNETQKTVYIRINNSPTLKVKKGRIPLYIVGTVKGVVEKKGQRSFQNAKYRELTPIFILERR